MDDLVGWEKRRIQNQKRLNDNKLYQFVQLVSAYSNTDLKRYIQVENAFTGGTRSITGPNSGGVALGISPLKSPPFGGVPITVGRGPRNPNLNLNMGIGRERTVWDLLEDINYRDDTIKALGQSDMANSLDWLNDSQVNGIMDISPLIYAHTLEAYQYIQDNCDGLKHYSLEDLAVHGKLRTVFARLVAVLIDLSKFLAPTRSQLDKNYGRLMKYKSMIIYHLNNYQDNNRINNVFGGIQNSSNILGNRTFSTQQSTPNYQINFQGFYP